MTRWLAVLLGRILKKRGSFKHADTFIPLAKLWLRYLEHGIAVTWVIWAQTPAGHCQETQSIRTRGG